MKKQELQPNEFNSYYGRYIELLNEDTTLISGLEQDKTTSIDFFSAIPSEKLEFRYQPEKWTVKEVIQHIIDTERVFAYRCFTIARGDKTKLPDFDENAYIPTSEANRKTTQELITEFSITRDFTLSVIKSFSNEALQELGNASNSDLSARACGFIILAHRLWHTNVIKERYL